MRRSANRVAIGGITAALYVILTLIASALGLSSGAIQFRFSEALCILPMFTPYAIPGLAIGCFVSNLIAGGVIWDMVFGTIATLIGAVGTRLLRKHRWLAPMCPVISNMVIVPFILQYAYGVESAYWFLLATVGLGEVLSAYVLGEILYSIIVRRNLDRKIGAENET